MSIYGFRAKMPYRPSLSLSEYTGSEGSCEAVPLRFKMSPPREQLVPRGVVRTCVPAPIKAALLNAVLSPSNEGTHGVDSVGKSEINVVQTTRTVQCNVGVQPFRARAGKIRLNCMQHGPCVR